MRYLESGVLFRNILLVGAESISKTRHECLRQGSVGCLGCDVYLKLLSGKGSRDDPQFNNYKNVCALDEITQVKLKMGVKLQGESNDRFSSRIYNQ